MQNKLSKATLGKLLLVLVTIVWGSSFVILKDTLSTLGDGHFTFFILASRFIIASVLLVAICWKKFITISKSTFLKGLILGFILFGAYSVQTIGLRYTSASKNAFLTSVYVVLVPFLSWLFLKKKPTFKNYLATALCFVGIAFVAVIGKKDSASNEILGDILSIASGIFYALQIIFISKHTEKEDAMQLLIVELLTVAVLCSIISLSTEFSLHASKFSMSGEAIWKLLYLAFICTLFAQFGQMVAQKYAPPMSVALIFSLESVFGVVFELLLGDANLTVFIIIGFVFIFIGEIVSEVDLKQLLNPIFKRKNESKIQENHTNDEIKNKENS
ncbi:MAG: DMT family transporter [Clostridia bacterium]|nr:DMT family transporter [Clostridia bacterium]